jgi:predicted nucleic acid-binding protein
MTSGSVIVSDATTLIVLQKQQKLSLLCQLFQQVLVPDTVYQELLAGLAKEMVLKKPECIVVEKVELSTQLKNLLLFLDAGEAEAIELAAVKQLPLIIDEKKGRKVAQYMGLTMTGLAGLLILAVRKKTLTAVQAQVILDRAIQDGYRFSGSLYQQVIQVLKAGSLS